MISLSIKRPAPIIKIWLRSFFGVSSTKLSLRICPFAADASNSSTICHHISPLSASANVPGITDGSSNFTKNLPDDCSTAITVVMPSCRNGIITIDANGQNAALNIETTSVLGCVMMLLNISPLKRNIATIDDHKIV